MNDSLIPIVGDLAIPASELSFRASRSGGPGGQHANTSSTRVELIWDVAGSPAISEEQRARISAKLANRISGDGLLTLASESTRSQHRNREDVIERFAELVREALHVPPERRRTKPTRAAREKRLREKKMRSERKRLRRGVPEE